MLLWSNALKGDKAAFKQLLEIYFPILYNYGMGFSQDKEVVKDTIQDLFIVIWNSRSNLKKEVNVKAYLLCSFRRALQKKANPRVKTISLTNYQEDRSSFHLNTSVEEDLIRKESVAKTANNMVALVNALPSRQKEVVYLHFFSALSRDEISEILGIAPQTVSNILQMALKKLRASARNPVEISA